MDSVSLFIYETNPESKLQVNLNPNCYLLRSILSEVDNHQRLVELRLKVGQIPLVHTNPTSFPRFELPWPLRSIKL